MNVIIDGRFVLDEADLQRRVAGALGYGPMYAHTLEALRKQLADDDPRPLRLTWIYVDSMRLALGAQVFDRYVAMFEELAAADAGREWNRRFVFRLFD